MLLALKGCGVVASSARMCNLVLGMQRVLAEGYSPPSCAVRHGPRPARRHREFVTHAEGHASIMRSRFYASPTVTTRVWNGIFSCLSMPKSDALRGSFDLLVLKILS